MKLRDKLILIEGEIEGLKDICELYNGRMRLGAINDKARSRYQEFIVSIHKLNR